MDTSSRGPTLLAQRSMPMRDPVETFAEIAAVARRVLPGARLRRRLFFGYTLAGERPNAQMPDSEPDSKVASWTRGS